MSLEKIVNLKSTTIGIVLEYYLQRFAALFAEPTALPPSLSPYARYGAQIHGNPGHSLRNQGEKGDEQGRIKEEVKNLSAIGFISSCANPLVNPFFAFLMWLPASDEHGADAFRLVYDFIKLNAITDLLPPVLPRVLDLVRHVVASRYFSKMDIRAGFYNLRVYPDSVKYTA